MSKWTKQIPKVSGHYWVYFPMYMETDLAYVHVTQKYMKYWTPGNESDTEYALTNEASRKEIMAIHLWSGPLTPPPNEVVETNETTIEGTN
jgi:hypothetical protein